MHDGLSRFSTLPFVDHQRITWVDCYGGATTGAGDCLAEKGFSVATTELADGFTIHVYNLHAEAGSGDQDNQVREAGIRQLIQFAQNHSADQAIIMGGDFNLHGNNPIDGPLFETLMIELNLTDSCRSLECEHEIIDRVLFRSNAQITLQPTTWSRPTHFQTNDGEPLSDHDPVAVKLLWKALEPGN